ncbi:MAG: hypothetical protein RL621_50 [Bacteroidota bacterium]|jgi:hypothetical protein
MKVEILKCGERYTVKYKEGWFYSWVYVIQYNDGDFHLQKERSLVYWENSYGIAEKIMDDFIHHLKKTHAKIEVVKSVKIK